jgi:hypothetical protein
MMTKGNGDHNPGTTPHPPCANRRHPGAGSWCPICRFLRVAVAVAITAPVAALGLCLLLLAWACWGGDVPW